MDRSYYLSYLGINIFNALNFPKYFLTVCYKMVKRFFKRSRKNTKRSKMPSFSKRVLQVVNKQRELKVSTPLNYISTDVAGKIVVGELK